MVWDPGGEDDIFSRGELIKALFEVKIVSSRSPAAFDQKETRLDEQTAYIKRADLRQSLRMAKPFYLEEAGRQFPPPPKV